LISIDDKYKELKNISISRGGDCLGYENKRFVFKCKFNHEWKAKYYPIKEGTWCPECSSGLYERITRYYFETLFDNKFPSIRPKWLRSPKTGRVLELDGYCEKLKLAFEHNGFQHYKKYMSANLHDIQYRDNIKKEICKLNGITLIVIPELFTMTELKDLKNEIKKQCMEQEFIIPNNYDDIIVDLNKAYIGLEEENIEKFKNLKDNCFNRNIKLHFNKYISAIFDFNAECLICKTIWKTSYNRLNRGIGCPKCSVKNSIKKRTYNYSFVKNFLKNKGYKLISKEYVNCKKYLLIECKFCKNNWNITFDNFKRGYRCPLCVDKHASKKRSRNPIEEIHKYCKEKNGICLENKYKGKNKYKCKCDKGHIFFLYWRNPKNTRDVNCWCDECKKENKLKEIKDYCESKNLKCLETKFESNKSNYRCMCENGHIFILRWGGVNGTKQYWCVECKKRKKMNRTTIMMVTYNRLNLTKQTFETTLSNAGENFNLIIVDNDSTDGTKEWLKENINKYELIREHKIIELNENKGIAYGRNMGLKTYDDNFDTPYLCTLDNDVELPNNWLSDCCDVLKNNNKIGGCGVNLEGVRYNKAFVKIKDENRSIEIQIKPRGNLGTAAAVFKKEIHDRIGFFCNDFEKYGHEDSTYFFIFRMLKYLLVYLGQDGIHLGVGEEDSGEYREMKDKYWKLNMPIHDRNIKMYLNGLKPLYTGFVPDED